MVGTTIAFWITLFVSGFALLYLPLMREPGRFLSPAEFAPVPSDALYFSAVSFLTTGYGDIVPAHWLARLLAVAEGALGLLTISLSVTYLLSVYRSSPESRRSPRRSIKKMTGAPTASPWPYASSARGDSSCSARG